ncbi:MAG TPA: hypothetical protein VLN49_09845 [Gemmatimonadaceae bacterium]|nr:hypothetical protein [Gemmatimonadaceae bacterium]
MDANRAARLGFTTLLAFYGFRLLLRPGGGSLMDSVDLPIHETGHLVFAPFGEFMQFLGGTLFQLIMPGLFVGYFLRRKDRHAASCVVWWLAQNCWNISVYVRDARAQELPLVGGGEHDWAYMLGRFGWLPYDQSIGHAFWRLGVLLYVLAIGGGLLVLVNSPASAQEPVELAAD